MVKIVSRVVKWWLVRLVSVSWKRYMFRVLLVGWCG